jgi:hypothetical protein
MFGAPIEEVYAVEAIQERDIEFIGGAGDEIMIAAGIAPISYLGRSLLIGRAEVADTLDSVIGSFDDFINENLSG